MKNIDYYMTLAYRMEIIKDTKENGYIASYPELPGCISCGDSYNLAIENLQDAKKVWLEVALEDGIDIPEPDDTKDYSGQFKLRIPKSLHKKLVLDAKKEGVSMNQYCVYLLSKNSVFTRK